MADLLQQLNQGQDSNKGVNQLDPTPFNQPGSSNRYDAESIVEATFADGLITQPTRSFLDAISKYASSIPLKDFWIVTFKIPDLIKEQELRDFDEYFHKNDFASDELKNPLFMKNIGCIFCRGVNFNGERNIGQELETMTRGFRNSPISGYRQGQFLQNLDLTFYESTISFIDHILRPWNILMSYYSTVIRNPRGEKQKLIRDLRQDITLFLYSRQGVTQDSTMQGLVNNNSQPGRAIPNHNLPPKVRKTIVFKNCFPMSFENLDYLQSGQDQFETTRAIFSYSHYEITAGKATNVTDNIFTPETVIFNQPEFLSTDDPPRIPVTPREEAAITIGQDRPGQEAAITIGREPTPITSEQVRPAAITIGREPAPITSEQVRPAAITIGREPDPITSQQ